MVTTLALVAWQAMLSIYSIKATVLASVKHDAYANQALSWSLRNIFFCGLSILKRANARFAAMLLATSV